MSSIEHGPVQSSYVIKLIHAVMCADFHCSGHFRWSRCLCSTCQVSQLYDVVQKWDAMSTSIPQVVQRLVAVKELHEQGNAQQPQALSSRSLCPGHKSAAFSEELSVSSLSNISYCHRDVKTLRNGFVV